MIRGEYRRCPRPYKEIGQGYAVCHTLIRGIILGVYWTDLDYEPPTYHPWQSKGGHLRIKRPTPGVENSQAKLTEANVLETRFALADKTSTIRQLATRFGVSKATIEDVWHGRTWTHIGGPIGESHPTRGVHHPNAQLTPEIVRTIRQDYEQNGYSVGELATNYGRSTQHISKIVQYKLWRTITIEFSADEGPTA